MIIKRVDIETLYGRIHSETLAHTSAKSGYYSAVTQSLRFVLTTLHTVVLARLLSPDDFGLVAMVSVLTNMAAMFKDAGLSLATVQKSFITKQEVSGLFWINVIISGTIALAMIAISPFVSSFYGRNELVSVVTLLAIAFFISGLSVQHNAILQRLLRFDIIGVVLISSQIVGLFIAVGLAMGGYGYMSLIISNLAIQICMTIFTIYYIPWFPSKRVNVAAIKQMLVFGGNITGFNVINYLSRNLDNVLIGKYIGSSELGIYDKVYQIFMMPIIQIRTPANAVAIPVLSRISEQKERFARYCSAIVELLAVLSIPIALISILESEFIIDLLLGNSWEGGGQLLRILGFAGIIQVVLGIRGSIMISLGLTRRYLVMGSVYAGVNIISFVIGLKYGVEGIAIAFVIAQYLLLVPSLFYCFHGTPFSVALFIRSVYPQLLIAVFVAVVYLAARSVLPWSTTLSVLTVFGTILSFGAINYSRLDFRRRTKQLVRLTTNRT